MNLDLSTSKEFDDTNEVKTYIYMCVCVCVCAWAKFICLTQQGKQICV